MTACLVVSFAGSLLFAVCPTYAMAVATLFAVGGSFAALQVVINPLLRVAGGEEHFAYNSTLAQLIFCAASFLSPFLYTVVVETPERRGAAGWLGALVGLAPAALPWVTLYWLFAALSLVMAAVVVLSRFPRVERTAGERAGTLSMYGELLRRPVVLLYFTSVFLYVGTEQGVANWISEFLRRYHGYDPHTVGAAAVAWFWGSMVAGCLAGMLLLKLFDSRAVLLAFSAGAHGVPDGGAVGRRGGCAAGFSGGGPVCFGDVADHHLAGAELGFRAPRAAFGNFLRSHCGRRRVAGADRGAGGHGRAALGNVPAVRQHGMGSGGLRMGPAAGPECHRCAGEKMG